MTQRRRFQTSDGVFLSVIESGPREAALTFALIPGWCMPGWLWQPHIDALGKHYAVAALDPRGQGESDVPDHGYNFERRAADICEFLRPYENVVLVGWSLGALEALEYTQRHGEGKLAGLVLVDSSVGELPVPPPEGHFLDDLRSDREKELRDFVRAMYARPRPEPESARLLSDVKRMSLDNSIALLSSGIPREHWKACAHAVKKPLLYVVTPQFEEQARNLEKNRPGTRIEIFQDAGHALFADEPQRFDGLMLGFAKSLTRKE